MKNYFRIFSLLFKYIFRKGGEKSSKWIWAAYIFVGLVFAFIILSICLAVGMLAETVNAMGMLPEFVTLMLAMSCVGVVLFGLVPMMTYLYFSRDTEFMLTLPVKPSTVFMAKLSVVYITEIIVSTVILLPAILTVGIMTAQGAVFYIVMLFAVLLVPAIPLVLVAVLAIPLMWVVSFFKNKGALASIVMILLGCGVFAAYYALIAGMSSSGDNFNPEEVVAALSAVLNNVADILIPLAAVARLATLSPVTAFGEFSVGTAAMINLAVFVGFAVVLLALAVLVSSAVYRRGARSILEGGTKKNNGKVEFKQSGSALSALFKKEWRELVRTPAFAFQCLSGILLCPIIIYFMSSMFTSGFEASGGADEVTAEFLNFMTLLKSFVLIGFISMFSVSMNVGAPTAITREGGNCYVLKTMPVPYRTIVTAKLLLYVLISSLSIVTSLIVSSIMAFDLANVIFGTIFLLLYNYGYNCVCVYIDLRRPKLNWSTPNEAVKNNRNSVVPMLINMAASIVIIALPVVFLILIPSTLIAKIVAWTLLCGVGVAAAIVFHNLLFANADRLFDNIAA